LLCSSIGIRGGVFVGINGGGTSVDICEGKISVNISEGSGGDGNDSDGEAEISVSSISS